jgi:ATP-dependent DNA helicase PIF1
MVDLNLFELLDFIARNIRKADIPFGGLQVVVLGDFFQLPPTGGTSRVSFAFEGQTWEQLGFGPSGKNKYILKNVLRQKERNFVDVLNEIRLGHMSSATIELLNSCVVTNKPRPQDGIIPTKLYCTNVDVNNENAAQLNTLETEEVIMESEDGFLVAPSQPYLKKYLLEQMDKIIPKSFPLKVGAQVILLRNKLSFDSTKGKTLVNGSRGVIIRFTRLVGETALIPVVRFDNGQIKTIKAVEWTLKGPNGDGTLVRLQIPLKLAWYDID